MIRCGWGYYHEDPMFRTYADACETYGIPYGFYHYSYATNLNEAQLEVEGMMKSIKEYKPDYPICIDMEDADGWKEAHGNPSNQMYVNICSLFCKTLEKNKYYAAIYANRNWFETKLNSSVLDGFTKWLAEWTDKPTYTKKIGIWQYTDTGSIVGTYGNVDMNIAYEDYPLIISSQGLNNHEESTIEPGATPEPTPEQNVIYTVLRGDTLWGIAQKFYADGNRYTEIASVNSISNPNFIKPGQKLLIPNHTGVNSIVYIVKTGDNLSTIASRYGVSWQTIYNNNRSVIGSNPNLIQPGQALRIR